MDLILKWWLDFSQDLLKEVHGHASMSSIELILKYYQLLHSKCLQFKVQLELKKQSLNLEIRLFHWIWDLEFLLQWILDMQVELSFLIILKLCLDLLLWWFLIIDLSLKSFFIVKDLKQPMTLQEKWSSFILYLQNNYPNRIIMISVWEQSNLYLLWLDLLEDRRVKPKKTLCLLELWEILMFLNS